jgi:predicted nucleotidyltransferase/uncharacterized protein (UPF0332 family)
MTQEQQTPQENYSMPNNQNLSEEEKQEIEKNKQEIEKLKKHITKKYPFTIAIGLIPPQMIPKIEEEEKIPEAEKNLKRIHVAVIVPEDNFKEIPKIKDNLVEFSKEIKQKLWFHIITPVDIWNFYMDSRYDLGSSISMSFPVYDKGLLGALRVAEVHKDLVMKKFEKYVSSYVIAGSLVRGTATKTSDIDVFVIIDDTDVKRMPRLELKERLRGIIYEYISTAQAIAGTKNKLEPQIYLLTDFWESVKDANPVMFTFIRDGIPLYDRGTFIPWKLLLKMGKIKPSPEAIDMFMSMGDKTDKIVKRRLLDIVVQDIYWGVITPSQAMLMLYGLPPPVPKDTAKIFKETFVDKEKVLEKKYVNTLDEIVKIYKDYEHEKIKEIPGKKVDDLLKKSEDYIKRLKQLRIQIEDISYKSSFLKIESETFELLKNLLGNKPRNKLIELFDKEIVKKGKMSPRATSIIKEINKISPSVKKGKVSKTEIERIRKEATILINELINYGQRCDFVAIDKSRMQIITEDKKRYDLIITNTGAFLIEGTNVQKITDNITESSIDELNKAIDEQKGKLQTKTKAEIFEKLKAKVGNFDIIL